MKTIQLPLFTTESKSHFLYGTNLSIFANAFPSKRLNFSDQLLSIDLDTGNFPLIYFPLLFINQSYFFTKCFRPISFEQQDNLIADLLKRYTVEDSKEVLKALHEQVMDKSQLRHT